LGYSIKICNNLLNIFKTYSHVEPRVLCGYLVRSMII
jgi:hypothetical protein